MLWNICQTSSCYHSCLIFFKYLTTENAVCHDNEKPQSTVSIAKVPCPKNISTVENFIGLAHPSWDSLRQAASHQFQCHIKF